MSGPFPFLNPTIRRSPIPVKPQTRSGSETGNEQTPNGETTGSTSSFSNDPAPEEEVRASAVEQKWRSRDNRKGMRSCAS
jgi:hypothetical protein